VIRFDFLHDARPQALQAIRDARLPRRLHNVLGAFATVVLCLAAAAAIENVQLNQARADEQRAEARVQQTRATLSGLEVQWRELDGLIARDRKLRSIRVSGPAMASRLARLGNLLSDGSWLTAMTSDSTSDTLKGRGRGINDFAGVLGAIVGSGELPTRVSVSRERRGVLSGVSFEIDTAPAR